MSLTGMHKELKRKLRTDIALSRDESSQFLPWIIALMVYLAALILTGSFTLSSTIKASHNAQMQSFSVHLPHTAANTQDTSDKVLDLVKGTPGVESAEIITPARIQEMVEPWFGKSGAITNLPLPVIIEAKIQKGQNVDYEALKSRIMLIVPNATLDDHKKWLGQFSAFVGIVQLTLLVITLFIIMTTACVVIFACKTSLKIHRGTVHLLHRLGALDSYIAGQFQSHAAFITLKGAFIGSGFASLTMMGLHQMAHQLGSPLFPSFTLSLGHWLILFSLPLVMSGLAFVAARVSVLSNLRRMP
jgi:cell division transport system permease protein